MELIECDSMTIQTMILKNVTMAVIMAFGLIIIALKMVTGGIGYGTTADFEYCPVCGNLNDHYEGDDCCYESGYSCGEYETITEAELLKRINEFEETNDEYIEYK